MRKIVCRVRYLFVKLYVALLFRGKVKIGVTGSMRGIPYFSVNNDGVIDIEPHCRMEKSQMAVVRGGKILVGEGTSIGDNDILVSHGEICIGKNCSLAPNICIYDHDHKFSANGKIEGFKVGKVVVGDNVWCGAGVIILRDTVIGDNCVIGAGTVVKGVIPQNSIVTSNRQLIIKQLH